MSGRHPRGLLGRAGPLLAALALAPHGTLPCDLCDGLDREGSSVIRVTEREVAPLATRHDVLLLGFYAPWCEVCKWFAPTYEKVADALREDGVLVAKANAADEPRLAKRLGATVSARPELVVFRRGRARRYAGGLGAAEIVAHVRAQLDPAVHHLGDEEARGLDAMLASAGARARPTVIVRRCADAGGAPCEHALDEAQMAVVDEVAGVLTDEVAFVSVPAGAREGPAIAASEPGCAPPGPCPRWVPYGGPLAFDALQGWALYRAAPPAAALGLDNVRAYLRRGHLALLLVEAGATAAAPAAVARLAEEQAARADNGSLPLWVAWASKGDPVHANLVRKLGTPAASSHLVLLNITSPGAFVQHTLRVGPLGAPDAHARMRTHADSYAGGQLWPDGWWRSGGAGALVGVVVVAIAARRRWLRSRAPKPASTTTRTRTPGGPAVLAKGEGSKALAKTKAA